MHIISQRRVWEAKLQYPNCASALDGWYRVMSNNQFDSFTALKKIFGSVDKVKNYYIFNIGGNKLRLIANIHFNRHKVYIRYILNHKEYDKNIWNN